MKKLRVFGKTEKHKYKREQGKSIVQSSEFFPTNFEWPRKEDVDCMLKVKNLKLSAIRYQIHDISVEEERLHEIIGIQLLFEDGTQSPLFPEINQGNMKKRNRLVNFKIWRV